ncbi:MAG: tape measure protein [Paracoccus sp. (in: a-proteobacteria)]|nr:tape measure protein [Paracoccus sp. (in: a-proteobacteria)]
MARVEAEFTRASQRSERNFLRANEKIAKDFERLKNQANMQLGGIKLPALGIGGALAGFVSTRELVNMTSAWTDLSGRVGLAIGDMEAAPQVMSRIADMARRTYSDLQLTAEGWLLNSTALADFGLTTNQSLDYVEALNNAMVVSGAKAQRAEAVQNALSKAMTDGALTGQNLTTVIQSGGRVAELLAAELGTTVGGLRALGRESKITGQVIDRALRGNLEKLREEAGAMAATIPDAFVLLKNALLVYVGGTDDAVGATARLAEALIFLADNIDLVVAAGGVMAGRVLGPAMLSMLMSVGRTARAAAVGIAGMGTAATATTGALAGLRAAMAIVGGPVGVVLAGLALLPRLTSGAASRTQALQAASSEAATALNAFATASERAKREQSGLSGEISRATDNMLTQARANMQQQLIAARTARQSSLDGLSSGIIFSGDIDRAINNLHAASQSGANFNRELWSIRTQLQGVSSGRTNIANLVREMDRLAGAGDEVTNLLAEVDQRLSQGGNARALDEAKSALIDMARAIGGFENELDALENAQGAEAQRAAFDRLRQSMATAAQAGAVLRRDLYQTLRKGLRDIADSERMIKALEAALDGNLELAQEIMAQGDIFAEVSSGARVAASRVRELAAAYSEYDASRRAGQEWANSRGGLEAGYVAARARGAGSQDEELVRAVVSVSERLGIAARDLLAVMSFETGGKLRPDVMGPTTKWGQHFGLIQFGEPQGRRYGVSPQSSITDQVEAAGRYLVDAGVRAGDSLANVYAAVLSGNARNVTASDLAAGGVVSNVTDAVNGRQFDGHIARAEALLGAYGGVVNEVEQRERDLVDAQKDAQRAAEDLAKERERQAKADLESRQELLEMAQRQIADAEFELTLVGKSAAEQARLRTEYMLTNEAKQRGIDLTEKMAGSEQTYGQQIAETARQAGELAEKQEEAAKAYQRVEDRARFYNQVQQDLKNGLLDSIIAGKSFADVLGKVAQMLARAALQAALFNEGPMSGGAGKGLVGGLIGSIFGGFRASGGPVSPGRAYIVGERGPEMIVPKTPGTVIPNHALGRGNNFTFAPTIHVGGNVTHSDIAAIRAEMNRERRNFAANVARAQQYNAERFG